MTGLAAAWALNAQRSAQAAAGAAAKAETAAKHAEDAARERMRTVSGALCLADARGFADEAVKEVGAGRFGEASDCARVVQLVLSWFPEGVEGKLASVEVDHAKDLARELRERTHAAAQGSRLGAQARTRIHETAGELHVLMMDLERAARSALEEGSGDA